MTRWHQAYSIVATLFAGAVGVLSLTPVMASMSEAVVLFAPAPAVLALVSDWSSLKGVPPRSLPLWTRLLWFAGLAGGLLVGLSGLHYSSGGTRAELAHLAPGWAFIGVWFGYNAILCAWTKQREAPHGVRSSMTEHRPADPHRSNSGSNPD
jgi:hypothetical protein